VAGLALLVLPVHGSYRVNTTYTGTHDNGGTVDFDVDTDGFGSWISRARVTMLDPSDIDCSSSFEIGDGTSSVGRIADDETFTVGGVGANGGFEFVGGFAEDGSARGTFRELKPEAQEPGHACDTGDGAWTASTDDGDPAPTAGYPPIGDVNCDFRVDGQDMSLVLQYFAGLHNGHQDDPCPDLDEVIFSTQDYDQRWADLNCNDTIDAIDALIPGLIAIGTAPEPDYFGCVAFPGVQPALARPPRVE
jgi:Dockerin type I domain